MQRLTATVLAGGLLLVACGEPTGGIGEHYEPPVSGYSLHAGAQTADAATGDALLCQLQLSLHTDGPLPAVWQGTAEVTVVRSRHRGTSSERYDTVATNQPVRATRFAADSVRLVIGGVIADTLVGREDPAYRHWIAGTWRCGPDLPLARIFAEEASGTWTAQPWLPID